MTTGTTPPVFEDERAARAHELLVDQLRTLTSSDQWLQMLDTARRFHNYSARNTLLLIAQGARGRVAGYHTWHNIPARDGKTCQVRKGAKALTVLAPVTRPRETTERTTGDRATQRVLVGFKPVRVFDETALISPPADIDVLPQLLQGDAPKPVFDALAAQVRAAGFTVEDGDCAPANGRTDWLSRAVTLRPDLDPAQRTKTLGHELAHVLLHDPDKNSALRAPRERLEVEAESVAYLVCAHAGLDSATYTIPYVAHWSGGDVDLVQSTAERVIDAARVITDQLDATLQPVADPSVAQVVQLPTGHYAHTLHDAQPDDRSRALHPAGSNLGVDDEVAAAALRRRVEADATRLLARLAANPDAWNADPDDAEAVRRAATVTPAASNAVADARDRIADLIHHPAAPEPLNLDLPSSPSIE